MDQPGAINKKFKKGFYSNHKNVLNVKIFCISKTNPRNKE